MAKLTISLTPESGAFERLYALVDDAEWIRTQGSAGEKSKSVNKRFATVKIGAFGVDGSKYKLSLSWDDCKVEKSYTVASGNHSVTYWASCIQELKAET